MTDRTELARDLAVLADERRGPRGRHPSDDEMAFFAAGDLPAEDRDRIEEHVATCDHNCGRRLLAAFEDLVAFESDEPVAGEPSYLSDRRKIEARGRALVGELVRQSSPPAPWKRHFALAMAVLAGMVGGYLVSEMLNEPKPTVSVLDTPPMSEEIVAGDVVKTLFSTESRDRSTRGDVSFVEAGAGDFVFLLRPPREAVGFPGYLLEIEGSRGKRLTMPVDRSMVLEDYGLAVRIPRGLFSSGLHRLILVGHESEIATYEVEIRTTPTP